MLSPSKSFCFINSSETFNLNLRNSATSSELLLLFIVKLNFLLSSCNDDLKFSFSSSFISVKPSISSLSNRSTLSASKSNFSMDSWHNLDFFLKNLKTSSLLLFSSMIISSSISGSSSFKVLK